MYIESKIGDYIQPGLTLRSSRIKLGLKFCTALDCDITFFVHLLQCEC